MAHTLGLTPDDPAPARGLFRWSILYLFGICLLLLCARLPGADAFSLQTSQLLAALNLPAPAF
jgi:protoheme IX farnesyltransferase